MKDFKQFNGNYRGLVVETKDPRDIGRIKILIHGVYPEGTPSDCLPWAIPALGMYQSGGENVHSKHNGEDGLTSFNQTGTGGEFTVPFKGNHVWVFFDKGHHMHPVYFAMAPGEMDWINQKQYVKDKLDDKLQQINTFREVFQQEDGTKGFEGVDWADGAYVNARQNITTSGEQGPASELLDDRKDVGNNTEQGNPEIIGGKYKEVPLNIDNEDLNGSKSKNMREAKNRSWQNFVGLDIKPLFDQENIQKELDRKNKPHKYDEDWKYDDIDSDYIRDINRNITSKTSSNGATEIFDNRDGQENYYFIHQNYMENIDQHGSRKIFVGQNTTQRQSVKDDTKSGTGAPQEIRCNDELGVAGDKKTHVQGNTVDYTKGNWFIQVDKNTQIDINESFGIRVKKGDYDIIIDGDEDIGNNRDNGVDEREGGKQDQEGNPRQHGDLNVAIRNGNMEVYTKKNINIHCQGDTNLQVDGSMRTYVKKDYHMFVKGDHNTIIEGNKYETVEKNGEYKVKGSVKTEIGGSEFKDVGGSKHLTVGGARLTKVEASDQVTANAFQVKAGRSDFTGRVVSSIDFHGPSVSLEKHQHTDTPGLGAGVVTPPFNGGMGAVGPGSPQSGANVGGGSTKEQEQSNVTDPTHNGDRTQLAKRDHQFRTGKVKRQHDNALTKLILSGGIADGVV